MITRFILLLITCNFILASCYSQKSKSRTYFISSLGNDENPGTEKKPFKSLAKVNSITMKPGDQILLKGGDSFNGTLSINAHGAALKPNVISSYGKGRAIVNGENKEAIIIRGQHFKLKEIHTKGNGRNTGNVSSGIILAQASNGSVTNVRTEGFQKSGIEIQSANNIDIKDVQAVNNGFCGIHITGSQEKRSKNIRVLDCYAENNAGDPTVLDNHSGNGILAGWSDSVLIDHCTATNNGWDMPWHGNGPVGIWAYESDRVIIQYCISYRNKTSKGAADGGGFDLDGGVTNSVVQYCLSYENEGAGYGLFQYAGASLWNNNVLRYCVSVNDATKTKGSGGIFVWNGSDDSVQLADCLVYNNLIYSTHSPAIKFEEKSPNKNFIFYNNIFIANNEVIHGPSSGEKFLGNIWWKAESEIRFRGYNTLLDWSNSTGQEKIDGKIAGEQIDPLLVGPIMTDCKDTYQLSSLKGFQLSPTSPLKNKGLQLATQFKMDVPAHDFFGNPIPAGKAREPGVYELDARY